MRLRTFVFAALFVVFMGIVMFLIAGTIKIPSIWVYLAIRVIFSLACVLAMSESTARERLKPGKGAKSEPLFNIGSGAMWIAHIVIVSLDLGRFHWSVGFPVWLQVIGVIGMLLGLTLPVWALRHNEYLSAKIRIQSDLGQKVVTTGPYAIIRHPSNAGGVINALMSSLVFGSWLSIPPMLVWCGLMAYRTLYEEKMLFAELKGYPEYAQKVRYRFFPGIW